MKLQNKLIDQIIDFYSDKEKSNGFDNTMFEKCGSLNISLGRLKRAATCEDESDSVHSRYAIWANDVDFYIQKAIDLSDKAMSEDSLEYLFNSSTLVKAYRDIQVILDSNKTYQTSKLFYSYAKHLIEVDDAISCIIYRDTIIDKLRESTGNKRVDLPRDFECFIKNNVLKVNIKHPTINMQENSAAFEGWILALKSWLGSEIEYVVLDFELPSVKQFDLGKSESGHYNRFLYRLNNMLRLFPEWFFIEDSKESVISDFMEWLEKNDCMLNHSLKERESVIHTQEMERQIESWFAFHEGKKLLCDRWAIDRDKVFNQLPIGVFHNSIASDNAVFTRGASAIDLWGVGQDDETLHLIELKCGNNTKMGVISETLFYTAIIYDTCIVEEPLFTFGKYGDYEHTSDTVTLINGGEKYKRIYAHILSEQLHVLFDKKVTELIQEGLSNLNILFDTAKYNYNKKEIMNEAADI